MDYKNVQPLADFDWGAIDKKEEVNNEQVKQMTEQYEQTFKSFTEQDVIEGTIVSISDREAVVNIGFKSDGVIPASELRYNPDLKVGDKIEVYVESQEDSNGQLLLSHKKARILKSWDRVNEAYDKQEIITGYVKSRTKGACSTTSKPSSPVRKSMLNPSATTMSSSTRPWNSRLSRLTTNTRM